MTIRKITAWMTFDPEDGEVSEEDAIQALLESLADDCAAYALERDDISSGGPGPETTSL